MMLTRYLSKRERQSAFSTASHNDIIFLFGPCLFSLVDARAIPI